MSDGPPNILGYGRRRGSRWLCIAMLVVGFAAGIAADRYRGSVRTIVDAFKFRYYQHLCASWSLPPQTPVYDDDQSRVKVLRGRPGYAPVDGQEIEGYELPVGYAPPKAQLVVWGDESWPTTIFLHSVRIGAEERLVLVDAHLADNYPPEDGRTLVLWLRNKPFASSPQYSSDRDHSSYEFRLRGTDTLRIDAGEADPHNAGIFRIPYELNGDPGVIEGRLQTPDGFRLRVISGGLAPIGAATGAPGTRRVRGSL